MKHELLRSLLLQKCARWTTEKHSYASCVDMLCGLMKMLNANSANNTRILPFDWHVYVNTSTPNLSRP